MSKSRRPRVIGTDRPAGQGSGRKVSSQSPKSVGPAPSPTTREEFPQSIRSPPLVVDTRLVERATEIADALAARDSVNGGLDFWNALTEFAGIRTTFLDSGHLNVMLSFTKNPNKNVRRYAAQAIVKVGGRQIPLCFTDAFGSTVLAAMESDDSDVRDAVVPGLQQLAELSPEISGKACERAVRGLTDQDARIRAGCLRVLSAFGIDRVSSAVSDIRKALADASPEVQRSACNLLGWLEEDATGAIDDLMKCVGPGRDDAVRRAAALAIAKINPSGDRLSSGSGGKAVRADLLKFLREAGAVGRILRRSLEHGQSNDSSDSTSDSDLELQLFEVLTKKQLKFVRYLLKKRKPVRFDDLRTNIWRGKTTDENIEKMVQRANENLLQLKDTSLTIYTKDMHAGVTRSDK